MAKSSMLDKLTRNLDKAVTRALTKAALKIEGDAKDNAPVDTGNLRASIGHEVENLEATIGTNVEYAPHLELGTRYMPPQPYLYPAYKANIKKFEDYINQEIRRL